MPWKNYLIFCIFIFIASCSGLKIDRGVKDNLYFSTALPRVNIKIDPLFKYKPENKDVFFTIQAGRSSLSTNPFVFYNDGMDEVIAIDTIKAPHGTYFNPNLITNEKLNMYNAGSEIVNGKKYEWFVSIENCSLIKTYQKILGVNNDIKFYILHVKNLDKGNCVGWDHADRLSGQQRQIVDEFIKNSEKYIQILD